jgi:hypothetical protein
VALYPQVLAAQISAVDDALQAIADGAAVATTTVAVATSAELVQRRSLLVDGLQSLCDHGLKLQPQCETRVRVEATAAFAAALRCFATMFAVVDTDINPLASTVAGAGVSDAMVGAPAELVVQTVDFDGQPRTSGGEVVGVTLVRRESGDGGGGGGDGSGDGGDGGGGDATADGGGGAADAANRVVADVTDAGDGTYVCSYTATTAEGAWQLEVRVGANQVQGSPFAVRVSASVRLVYSGTPFDTAGVLHWIGTGEGARAYANPHGADGGVVAAMSSIEEGDPLYFVQQVNTTNCNNYTNQIPNAWMSVDLGAARRLAVDHYCLRHGGEDGWYMLRNWRLEGSNVSTAWVVLKTHTDDQALAADGFSTAAWPVTPPTAEGFRHFRIVQFGKNADDDDSLFCAGIELYGVLSKV